MDLVDEHADYDPVAQYKFELPVPPALRPEEQQVVTGAPATIENDDPGLVPKEDVW
jgi:hypothetical protein